MSQYDHNQSAGANPPPPVSTAPPPIGYPTNDQSHGSAAPAKVETKSKGDGFFKGCLAAMCCCCALDICF
ncbi:PREDICTED: cysteine-rich and transmembrane domain-containing protein A-like [Camelina sativa]|uniref:Cysteine-rich and transmembrane domain-containing protein A-like n=1 Tax=Camelina sativa TaxID=90675 RepID=A0ABM1RIK3_CAMSA|nr:PREDICTED: cysteine-rich and transmembrane domain-containing protein A-like [Camelina sativa]